MFYIDYLKKNVHYFFLDHKISRFMVQHSYMLTMCILSALFYAISFRTFCSLNFTEVDGNLVVIQHLATGGMSGIAQVFVMIVQFFGLKSVSYNTLQSIFYLILNLPLLIFAFVKLGVKFSLYSTLNVLFVSLFIQILPASFFEPISKLVYNDALARSAFAGIFTGLSSAFAFKANHSTGGIDCIAYYFSSRKSTPSGKYIVFFNGIIIALFTILTALKADGNYSLAAITACYSIAYLFMTSLVVDAINVRNKKVSLQIITDDERLSSVIVANVPHSCTIVKAKGGYSKKEKHIIYAVVSNSEVTLLVNKIKLADPNVFINAIPLRQVYGKFFIKPID